MKNQLSALMDGELDMESSEHLITSAKSGGELKNTWVEPHVAVVGGQQEPRPGRCR